MRALITGAANGLGNTLSQNLLTENWEVVAVDHNETALSILAQQWGGLADCRNVDLADDRAVDDLLKRLVPSAPFDLVILNAGISATGNFEDMPPEAYQRLLAVNTLAPIVMANFIMQRELMAPGGSIVMISSLSHAVGYPGACVYAASKDTIAVYAAGVAKKYQRRGTNLLTVFPGPIRTDHAERHAPAGADASKRIAPEILATLILQAVKKRKRVFYPGMAAKSSHVAGRLAPGFLTRMMRRIIFEKLDKPRY